MHTINLNEVAHQIGTSKEQLNFFMQHHLISTEVKEGIPYTNEEGLQYILAHVNLAGQLLIHCSDCGQTITSYKMTDDQKTLCDSCALKSNKKTVMSMDYGVGITTINSLLPKLSNRLIAEKIIGGEYLQVGYYEPETKYAGYKPSEPTASPRQLELRDWLDDVDLNHVGEYYIRVTENEWIHECNFRPLERMEDAWDVVQFLAKSNHSEKFNELMNLQLQESEFTELTPEIICRVALSCCNILFRQ